MNQHETPKKQQQKPEIQQHLSVMSIHPNNPIGFARPHG
jgi:hypothetical protein